MNIRCGRGNVYSGMPPEQIETDITSRFERFLLGCRHRTHRIPLSPGVSVIKVYFSPHQPDSR